jgi:hypothetical protein
MRRDRDDAFVQRDTGVQQMHADVAHLCGICQGLARTDDILRRARVAYEASLERLKRTV